MCSLTIECVLLLLLEGVELGEEHESLALALSRDLRRTHSIVREHIL